jgi:hypothetical protein
MSTLHQVLGVLLYGIRGILQGLVTVLSHTARPLWTSANPWEGHCTPTLDVDPPQGSGGSSLEGSLVMYVLYTVDRKVFNDIAPT